jgi:glycosyltransferase involved in cell wall biosynthesis
MQLRNRKREIPSSSKLPVWAEVVVIVEKGPIGQHPAVSETDFYFERFGFCERQIEAKPHPDLALSVVIPCHNEPDLVGALDSLAACIRPKCATEIIVVINSAATAADSVKEQNRRSYKSAVDWIREPGFQVHLILAENLPRKHAGVGLARKIGMDEATRRLDDVGNLAPGIIACFDADCTCAPNYLTALETHFDKHTKSPACSIRFEHPLTGDLDPRIYEAITAYELHLRYFIGACRFAEHPHAFHTIGSSMAVRAEIYIAQGGMNRRKAGEDFYFLQKIIPLGNFTELNSTRVIPSPRVSDRVPFGTGKAVGDALESDEISQTYPLEPFFELKEFFTNIDRDNLISDSPHIPPGLTPFLEQTNFSSAIQEIAAQTSSASAFRGRFFRWFDAFRLLKFVHFARDRHFGSREVCKTANELLQILAPTAVSSDPTELLNIYRQIQHI